ncbi:Hypothetical predicted protein, partial [Pelobates cultripes]
MGRPRNPKIMQQLGVPFFGNYHHNGSGTSSCYLQGHCSTAPRSLRRESARGSSL